MVVWSEGFGERLTSPVISIDLKVQREQPETRSSECLQVVAPEIRVHMRQSENSYCETLYMKMQEDRHSAGDSA